MWLGTTENAKAEGKLLPGAGVLLYAGYGSELAKSPGDGLGDYNPVGLYVGENAPVDPDKSGKQRQCNVARSGQTMGRVAGSTLINGYTHVMGYPELDYSQQVAPGVTLGAILTPQDTAREDPEGLGPGPAGPIPRT